MSSISAPSRTYPESVQDRLRNLTKGTRGTHWLTSNLNLVPSSQVGRFFFTCVVKHVNCLRWLFFGIDLNEAKYNLIRIGWQQIDQRNFDDVHLYRKASKAFDQYAPHHHLPEMKGYYLERLSRSFAKYVFKNLIDTAPFPLFHFKNLSENPEVGLSYNVIFNTIRDFEKRGGHVHALWARTKRENDEGFVLRKTDDIAPVCHAGLVRSKIIKEAIEQKLGIKTRDTHGVLTGYCGIEPTQNEGDFQLYFEEAFLEKRSKRFGYKVPLEKLSEHFNTQYWGKVNPNGRVIFITFGNAFAYVIDQVKKYHPHLDQVYILIIPDGDWISHYKGKKYSKESFLDLNKTDDRVAQALITNEPVLLNNPSFERDDYFVNSVGHARRDYSNPDAFYDFMQPHVYRHACYYYSNYFNLEA